MPGPAEGPGSPLPPPCPVGIVRRPSRRRTSIPMSASVDLLLAELWSATGTDLHLTAGAPPLGRVDGTLRPMTGPRLSPEDSEQLARDLVSEGQWKLLESG